MTAYTPVYLRCSRPFAARLEMAEDPSPAPTSWAVVITPC